MVSDGARLVALLKRHVLNQMRSDPACHPGGVGLGNIDIEEVCGLALHLKSQDHYLTYSLLCSLINDGFVERVEWPERPRRPKYRLLSWGDIATIEADDLDRAEHGRG